MKKAVEDVLDGKKRSADDVEDGWDQHKNDLDVEE